MIDLLRECRYWIANSDIDHRIVNNIRSRDLLVQRLDAALAGKDAVPLTSPSVAPADSESGSAVGSVGAAPGLPEFPTVFRTILPDAIAGQYESIVRGADYDTLRTVTLLAIKERDGAWAALRDAYYGVGSHDSAAWQKKHAATIAAARRGG